MRRGISIRGLAIAFALSLLFFVPAALWLLGIPFPGGNKDSVLPPSISVIRGMKDLVASEVHISDTIEGYNDHYKGKWSLHGEVLLGIDLSKVAYLANDPVKRTATLRLPSPHVVTHKVDHEHSEELYVNALVPWASLSSRQILRDEVWKMADRKLEQLGEEPGYKASTKVQAEGVLRKLFEGMGWTVTFEWQDNPVLVSD
jgi:hypothetical protein